jgi:hypothetical protein
MRLEDLKIVIPNVDNEPFVRSLTAVLQTSTFDDNLSALTYTEVTGNETFAWHFPEEAFATKNNGQLYPRGTVLPASEISTIVIYFSAEKYNFLTDTYTLNVLPISATSQYDTAYNQYIYDTFPDIDTTFYINYQPINQDYTFFDQTSSVNVATTAAIPFIENLTAVSRFPNNFTFTDVDNNFTNFKYLHYTGPKSDVTYFYRLTSLTPYKADLKLTSSNYTFSANSYDARFYLNNSRSVRVSGINYLNALLSANFVQNLTNIPNYLLNSWKITAVEPNLNVVDITYLLDTGFTFNPLLTTIYFSNTRTARASSVFVSLYVETPPNSKTAWYSPHRVERALSAAFVPYWLSAGDFIAWPKQAFINAYDLPINITPTNVLLSSPGLDFYGEGHTEYIYLSTQPKTNNTKINWYFGNSLMLSGTNSLSSTNSNVTAVVPVTTEIGFYPTIPITLQVTDTLFTSAEPRYYYDDNTGSLRTYPYIVSTIDNTGREFSTNTRLKQSIVVKPYDLAPFYFNSGISDKIYLPFNQTPLEYTATFQSTISVGLSVANPCYDKYGFIWNWNALTSDSRKLNLATTWVTLQSAISAGTLSAASMPGTYPKRWKSEGGLSAQAFNLSPIFCSAGPVVWTLSTTDWSNTFIDPLTSGLSATENQEGVSVFD